MYLKIILRYLNLERARENDELYFQENLPVVTISKAWEIINTLSFKPCYTTEIRFQNIFENKKMVGLLVIMLVKE